MVVGIVVAAIYFGQLNVMRGQLGEIIKQYPELQKSADAAKSAADTAEATLKSAKEQFRIEERPWITTDAKAAIPDGSWFQQVNTPQGTGYIYWITVYATNVGKTPAVQMIRAAYVTKVGPKYKVRKEVENYVPTYQQWKGGFLSPGSPPIVLVIDETKTKTLTRDEFNKVRDGTWELYTVGAIKYSDVFSPEIPPYETIFCFMYRPTGLPVATCSIASRIR